MAAAWALEVVPPLRIRTFDPGPMSTKLRGKAFPGEKPGTQPGPEHAAKRLVEFILT